MENLFKVAGGMMWAVLGKLAAKLPIELVHELNNDPGMIDAMVRAAYQYREDKRIDPLKNPFEMSVEDQLAALRRANDEEKWGITEEDFERLAKTAPTWPQGKFVYRSFRIRFGEGDEGVAKTFEAHHVRIQHVFGESGVWRWELLRTGWVEFDGEPVERMRLLNGNHTHHAVVEWILADLDAHRQRESVMAVRDSKSLADEMLVIAWMFPDMIRAINHNKLPGLFAAGYEVNVPEYDDEPWQCIVIVHFERTDRGVVIDANDRDDSYSSDSVPYLLELGL